MRVLVAIDSFKGSLTSLQAGNAVEEAIGMAGVPADVLVVPLADGGEGTVDALASIPGSEVVKATVNDPLLRPMGAKYCILADGTAVIEMAAASGLTLLAEGERNPLYTTTYGVGELILDAIYRGCRRFIIGIGGSATNDGGTGMLSALGFRFADRLGRPIPLGAQGLSQLDSIDRTCVTPLLKDCKFFVACDVNNPLCGVNGCSVVYGPQKGATEQMVRDMDTWLASYAKLAGGDRDYPGAGAAGGLGFAFLTFTNATLRSGIQLILTELDLEDHIQNADVVVTGEGKLDEQTLMGKAPAGVAALAKKYGKKVIAFCGCAEIDDATGKAYGIDEIYPTWDGKQPIAEAMRPEIAYRNLVNTAYLAFGKEEYK